MSFILKKPQHSPIHTQDHISAQEQSQFSSKQIPSLPPTHKPDDQQLQIIQAVIQRKNISINAVFGSGKTTTILRSVKECPEQQMLLVTYNTHLKNEVQEKVDREEITNLQVHTYHSLCMKYFGYGKNDEELQQNRLLPPKEYLPEIHTIFIDEKQDMTLILFDFIQKFLKYLPIQPQIVVCGDHLQGVYQFKGADKRFLTLASSIYTIPFEPFEMTTSYRLTHSMGWVINECIYGQKILNTVKEGPPVYLFNKSPYRAVYDITNVLQEYIQKGYKADDIFILSPSLRCGSRAPLKILENLIFEKLNLPIYYCTNEDRELNDKVIQNKVVFSTFHQSKGRERKIVVVFGMDESYYEFFAKEESRSICPSTVIVALSRAKELMLIVKDVERRPLPFMKKTILEMGRSSNVKVIGSLCDIEQNRRQIQKVEGFRKITVTDLVKYIKPENQTAILELKNLLFEKKTEILDDVLINPFVESVDNEGLEICEDVSDLIGLLIPSIYEEMNNGTSSIKSAIEMYKKENKMTEFMREKVDKVNLESLDLNDLLYGIKVYKAMDVGIYSPFQIDSDNWITEEQVQRIIKNISFHIQDKQVYECDFQESERPIFYHHPDFGRIYVSGRMDCLDQNHVWEFKCVKELSLEHFLQVVCYQWLWNLCLRNKYKERKFRLLNIRTGEMYELKNDESMVQMVMELLIMNRYEKMISISDEEFIQICLETKEK